MESSLILKAKSALQNVAAKAERVLTEIKADIKADFGGPPTPDGTTWTNGRYIHDTEFKAEYPWSAKNDSEKRYEVEFKRRILDLSKKPEDFLEGVDDDLESIDMQTAMIYVGNVLEFDEELKELWFQYVPKKMKELEFWRRYFIAVKRVRQEIIDADSNNYVRMSWSSIERRLTFGGTFNESLWRDPIEEEADSEAVSVTSIPQSVIIRRLAAAIETGRSAKSMQELVIQGGRLLDKDVLPSNGDWSGIVSGFAAMRRLSAGRGKDSKSRFSKTTSLGDYHTLLWSLFDADTQHEDQVDKKLSFTASPNLPRDIHGAPPESFVARLAEIMAEIKTEQGMGEFWLEVIKELRRRWKEGVPISLLPVDESPDLRYCLLHQQLQLINCCIARRKKRAADLESLEILNSYLAHEDNSSAESTDNHLAPSESLNIKAPVLLYAKLKTGEKVLRVGADHPAADLLMLETGEPVYSPITQDNPIMTEDAIREAEELILRTRSVGAGCSQLLSDMQAFKAANPGCILEDFVRWYSPLDWREEPGTGLMFQGSAENAGEYGAIRGYLSARMQCQGNLWQELWASSRPVPALKQSPLFDEELAGESTLDVLEDVAPSDLFEQLFLAALGAGVAIVEAAPAAKTETLARCLKECTEYLVITCEREMSSSKLERLCEVYEDMEFALHLAQCGSPVEAEAPSGPPGTTVVTNDDSYDLPEPIPFLEAEKVTFQRSVDYQQAQQFVKTDFGQLFSRMFEVKSSLFDKKHLSPLHADEERRPVSTVAGECTFV